MVKRVMKEFKDAVRLSERKQSELCAAVGLHDTQLSKFFGGGTFGEGPAEKLEWMATLIGARLATVAIEVSPEDEDVVAELSPRFSWVMDRDRGVVRIVEDATGESYTFAAFRAKFGERGIRWLGLPPEARRTYTSVQDHERAMAKRGAR